MFTAQAQLIVCQISLCFVLQKKEFSNKINPFSTCVEFILLCKNFIKLISTNNASLSPHYHRFSDHIAQRVISPHMFDYLSETHFNVYRTILSIVVMSIYSYCSPLLLFIDFSIWERTFTKWATT